MLIIITLVGCGTALFQDSQKIPNKNWEREHTIRFDVQVEDTMKGYDFYIDLRNEGTYPYANIYMFVNTTFPSGKTARDTVECMLADHTGKWLGKGLGDIWDNHILFKKNIRFPNTGIYSFEFEQGMRMEKLPAILDVGISIEDHSKK
ncbi:MAG: gliding motility lipoprotein GldH [Flavobacteriales bacterium]|nr:gliding motility lipoprotein GldH [Flavobacteriales bacterium]